MIGAEVRLVDVERGKELDEYLFELSTGRASA
jgi:hypothetical protein